MFTRKMESSPATGNAIVFRRLGPVLLSKIFSVQLNHPLLRVVLTRSGANDRRAIDARW